MKSKFSNTVKIGFELLKDFRTLLNSFNLLNDEKSNTTATDPQLRIETSGTIVVRYATADRLQYQPP